jgi:4-aminobutyrate aminotransferase/(S)-3-amino-2-methylpropionate transaminase
MSAIRLTTSIPGPKSQALAGRRAKAVPRGVSQLTPIFVERTEGAMLEDVDGNRFIDLAGGIGCMNMGHRAPAVTAAIHEQTDKFLHTCMMVTPYEGYVALAEKLNEVTPGNFPKKTMFVNSGAEAVENAVKIARAYTKRPAVVCFEDAFHGRTLMALALTSKTVPYKSGFAPFAGDVYRLPFGYCYRCSFNLTHPECGLHCAWSLKDAFRRVVDPQQVAAVIFEPQMGEGGFIAPPEGYFNVIQEICREQGILLIADEIQTGMARTGKMFGCEHYGIEPDLVITSKSLGGGLPIAGITGRAEIMDNTGPGSLGGTFGGNPVACASALAAIETIEKENLCDRAVQLGARFVARARKWMEDFAIVGDVRGLGAMQAIELVRDRASKTPADTEAKELLRYCYERGVILVGAGTRGNVVRVLMPLVISDADFDEGLDVMEAGLAQMSEIIPADTTGLAFAKP